MTRYLSIRFLLVMVLTVSGIVFLPGIQAVAVDTQTLDLYGNRLVIGATAGTSTLPWLQAMMGREMSALAVGRAAGAWNGPTGIFSSYAADVNSPSGFGGEYSGVGYLINSEFASNSSGTYYKTFGGDNLTSYIPTGTTTPVARDPLGFALIKPTWLGDTNLDGTVDDIDLNNLLAGYNTVFGVDAPATWAWYYGDVNYDGLVDDRDLNKLLATYSTSGSPFALDAPYTPPVPAPTGSVPLSSVPEPSTLALAAVALVTLAAVGRRMRGSIKRYVG